MIATLAAALASISATAQAQGTLKSPHVSSDYQLKFQVPNADGTLLDVHVSMPKGDPIALKKQSPSELSKKNAALADYIKGQCAGGKNPFAQVAMDFLPEASAFYSGVAMSAQLDLKKDPATLKHFYDHSLVDWTAHVSFAFFMLGSRMTTSALAMAGLHFDGCHGMSVENGEFETKMRMNLRKGTVDTDVRLTSIKPTKLQIRASALVGPLSMGVGFFASTLSQEFLTDPNIVMCGKYKTGQLTEADQQAGLKACDDGWNEWVNTEKITKYVPDLLAMTVTSGLQAYVINNTASLIVREGQKLILDKAKGAIVGLTMSEIVADEGIQKISIGLTLRTVMLVAGLSPTGAVVKFGMQALQAMVFVTVNNYILPWIKTPWENWQQGGGITGEINGLYSEINRLEKNKWAWTPKPKPPECNFDPQPIPDAMPYFPPECSRPDLKPGEMVHQLGEKYKKWRQFALADAYTAHTNWKDYLNRFQNTYADAENFYANLLKTMTDKDEPTAQADEFHMKLYQPAPFNGLNINVPTDICSMDPKDLAIVNKVIFFAQNAIAKRLSGKVTMSWGSGEIEVLRKIVSGLQALDCSENKDMSWQERTARYQTGIEALNRQVNDFNQLMQYTAMSVEDVKSNPFRIISSVLGDTKPLPAGMAYLIDINKNDSVIDQGLKDDHPSTIGSGHAMTSTMADYLLASMVCGPEAENVKFITQRPRNITEKALGWLGYDTTVGSENSIVNIVYGGKDDSAGKRINEKVFEIRASFLPPKIIAANQTLCNSIPIAIKKDQPGWNIHEAQFNIEGKTYKGLLEIVKNFVRQDVIGKSDKGVYAIDNWWSSNVDPHVLEAMNAFASDFQHIVDTKFIPTFTRKDSTEYNGRKFELGIANSMRAEAEFNLMLLGKAMHFEHGITKDRTQFVQLANQFLKKLKLQTDLFSDVYSADAAVLEIEGNTLPPDAFPVPLPEQPHFNAGQKRYVAAFNKNGGDLKAILASMDKLGTTAKAPETMSSLKEIRSAAKMNLGNLVTETDSYFGIVDTARMQGFN